MKELMTYSEEKELGPLASLQSYGETLYKQFQESKFPDQQPQMYQNESMAQQTSIPLSPQIPNYNPPPTDANVPGT